MLKFGMESAHKSDRLFMRETGKLMKGNIALFETLCMRHVYGTHFSHMPVDGEHFGGVAFFLYM